MLQQMPISEETYNAIFEEVAQGNSLRSCLTKYELAAGSFYLGLDNNPKRTERYARARKLQAEASFERILSLADKVEQGLIEPNAARVAIDTHKWVAARLHPQVYQERTSLLGDANGNTPTEITVRWSSKPIELIQVTPENTQESLEG